VFVHGLTGNRETTWTHKQTKTFWPQNLLGVDLPNARILTFGYDADVMGVLKIAGSNTLRNHGKSLANELALRRMRSSSVSKMSL
jgi:protein SERAC1